MVKMKAGIVPTALVILLAFIAGCLAEKNELSKISGIQELAPNDRDLLQLGMAANGSNCQAEEYETGEFSLLAQYSICHYTIDKLDDTEVVIELKKFSNTHDLNGSYQYESSHLSSSKGTISRDTFGDQSRFSKNHEEDYGGEFNEPGMHYYHLYFTKDIYLVHITSGGRSEEAKDYIANMGELILSKFG
jgi:hypothetical protein